MSDRITVREGDCGLVWVFAVDLDGPELEAFKKRNGSWGVPEALGVEYLDPDHVEVFPVGDLEGVGLAGYLEDGMGVPANQIADMRAELDARRGTVMVLSSKAFRGKATTLTPRAPLRLVASFSEDRPPVSFEPLPSGSATGSGSDRSAAQSQPSRGKSNILGPALVIAALVIGLALLIWGLA